MKTIKPRRQEVAKEGEDKWLIFQKIRNESFIVSI